MSEFRVGDTVTVEARVVGFDGGVVRVRPLGDLAESRLFPHRLTLVKRAREPKPGDRVRTEFGEGFVLPENRTSARLVIRYVNGGWDFVSEVLNTLEFLDDKEEV